MLKSNDDLKELKKYLDQKQKKAIATHDKHIWGIERPIKRLDVGVIFPVMTNKSQMEIKH